MTDPDLGILPDYEPTYADFLIDNASRPWDARDDAGWEHQDHEGADDE